MPISYLPYEPHKGLLLPHLLRMRLSDRIIFDFRAVHLKEAGLFACMAKFDRECVMVHLGTIRVDSAKLMANKYEPAIQQRMQTRKTERLEEPSAFLSRPAEADQA